MLVFKNKMGQSQRVSHHPEGWPVSIDCFDRHFAEVEDLAERWLIDIDTLDFAEGQII